MTHFLTTLGHFFGILALSFWAGSVQAQTDATGILHSSMSTNPVDSVLGIGIGDDLNHVRRIVLSLGFSADLLRDQVINDLNNRDRFLEYRRADISGEVLVSVGTEPGQRVDAYRIIRASSTDSDGTVRRLIVDVSIATDRVIGVTSYTEMPSTAGWLDPDAVEARLSDAIGSSPSCRDRTARMWAVDEVGDIVPPSSAIDCLSFRSLRRQTEDDIVDRLTNGEPVETFRGLVMTVSLGWAQNAGPANTSISLNLRDDRASIMAIQAALRVRTPGRADVDF